MPGSKGPLEGIKVVEITSIYSGPYAGMMLAELGAEVVKVESPHQPDPVRAGRGNDPDAVTSVFYALNRGKKFASIDARTPKGRELLFDLVSDADVFLHNMRVGRAEALGLDYESLSARNPGLVDVSINGLGADGPEADLPVFDYVIQAKTGMVDYQRDSEGRGDLTHQLIIDKTSANVAVQGVLAALFARERSGKGQKVEVPMIAVGLHLAWTDLFAPGLAQLEPAIPWEQAPRHLRDAPGSMIVVLQTKDGEITTGLLVPPWDGLCLALDRAEWIVDERFAEPLERVLNLPALIDLVRTEVAKYTTEEILARFAEHDFAAGRISLREEIFEDSTVKHLGLLSQVEAGEGIGQVRQPTPMWEFKDSGTSHTSTIGNVGRHTREVLAQLGLETAEIEELISADIAFTPNDKDPV